MPSGSLMDSEATAAGAILSSMGKSDEIDELTLPNDACCPAIDQSHEAFNEPCSPTGPVEDKEGMKRRKLDDELSQGENYQIRSPALPEALEDFVQQVKALGNTASIWTKLITSLPIPPGIGVLTTSDDGYKNAYDKGFKEGYENGREYGYDEGFGEAFEGAILDTEIVQEERYKTGKFKRIRDKFEDGQKERDKMGCPCRDRDIVEQRDRSANCFVNQRRKLRVLAFESAYDDGIDCIKSQLETLKSNPAEAEGRMSELNESFA